MKAACLLAAARHVRQALSYIQRGENKDPTFSTLQRSAAALGKQVIIKLQDAA